MRLAISLHAPDDETRRRIIPERVPYSVKSIISAGLQYAEQYKAHLTIEYVLIPEVNVSLIAVKKLVKLLDSFRNSRKRIIINLIPYNPAIKGRWKSPSDDIVQKFQEYLAEYKILSIVREAKGLDIGSACGQLGI